MVESSPASLKHLPGPSPTHLRGLRVWLVFTGLVWSWRNKDPLWCPSGLIWSRGRLGPWGSAWPSLRGSGRPAEPLLLPGPVPGPRPLMPPPSPPTLTTLCSPAAGGPRGPGSPQLLLLTRAGSYTVLGVRSLRPAPVAPVQKGTGAGEGGQPQRKQIKE